jgi:multidrug efflux pump subunit AcrA (membrane-fusion protein)
MDNIFTEVEVRKLSAPRPSKPGVKAWAGSLVALGLIAAGVIAGPRLLAPSADQAAIVAPPVVTVSAPIQQDVDTRLQFLGQFSAVDQVELRAQVGGTLTQIGFKDGDVVHKGDLLFTIDPTPYQIKLSEATAQLESARARLDFANREAFRADTMKQTGYGSVEMPTSERPIGAPPKRRATTPRHSFATRSSIWITPASPRPLPAASAPILSR